MAQIPELPAAGQQQRPAQSQTLVPRMNRHPVNSAQGFPLELAIPGTGGAHCPVRGIRKEELALGQFLNAAAEFLGVKLPGNIKERFGCPLNVCPDPVIAFPKEP